ncbi:MAG: hypothetical protein ABIX01_06275 [Chitinophagaceae bacterium]
MTDKLQLCAFAASVRVYSEEPAAPTLSHGRSVKICLKTLKGKAIKPFRYFESLYYPEASALGSGEHIFNTMPIIDASRPKAEALG